MLDAFPCVCVCVCVWRLEIFFKAKKKTNGMSKCVYKEITVKTIPSSSYRSQVPQDTNNTWELALKKAIIIIIIVII